MATTHKLSTWIVHQAGNQCNATLDIWTLSIDWIAKGSPQCEATDFLVKAAGVLLVWRPGCDPQISYAEQDGRCNALLFLSP